MKHEETSEDEDETEAGPDKIVDYDALDGVDGEEEMVKAEPETEDHDEEVRLEIANKRDRDD